MLRRLCTAARAHRTVAVSSLLSLLVVVTPPAPAWAAESGVEAEPSCGGTTAATVPGYGGSYVDADPSTSEITRVHVWLTEPNEAAAAKVRDAVVADCGPQTRKPDYVTHAADYTWTQLLSWHRSLGDVLSLPGVVLTDVDETRNRLVVGVNDRAKHGAAVEQTVARLGIPRAAVIIETRSAIRQLPSPTNQRSAAVWRLGAALLAVAVAGLIGTLARRQWIARRRASAAQSSPEPDSSAVDHADLLRR